MNDFEIVNLNEIPEESLEVDNVVCDSIDDTPSCMTRGIILKRRDKDDLRVIKSTTKGARLMEIIENYKEILRQG
jgi:hypothetical protein